MLAEHAEQLVGGHLPAQPVAFRFDQRAEFLLEKGFIDNIVERRKQKEYIAKILRLHTRR